MPGFALDVLDVLTPRPQRSFRASGVFFFLNDEPWGFSNVFFVSLGFSKVFFFSLGFSKDFHFRFSSLFPSLGFSKGFSNTANAF